jgi:hypothetical protein
MPEVVLRKLVTRVEEIFHEGGPPAELPPRRGVCVAVIQNPYAGRYVADIAGFMEDLKPLGARMANKLLAALGGDPGKIEGYGKGAIVGEGGELEHGALWHVPGGYAMRELLGGKAVVASTKKVGGVGAHIDIPITHIRATQVRSHYDAIDAGVADAPRANEIALVIAMTTGPRVHARVGGLAAADIKGIDGLR